MTDDTAWLGRDPWEPSMHAVGDAVRFVRRSECVVRHTDVIDGSPGRVIEVCGPESSPWNIGHRYLVCFGEEGCDGSGRVWHPFLAGSELVPLSDDAPAAGGEVTA